MLESVVDGGVARITQGYGCTCSGLEWTCPSRGCGCARGFHNGVDLAAPAGRVVRASGFGVVAAVGRAFGCCPGVAGGCATTCGLGPNAVAVRAAGLDHWFGHLRRACVVPGQPVVPGTALGEVGSCGCATGPHVHRETDPAGVVDGCRGIDPSPYLLAWPGGGMAPVAAVSRPGYGPLLLVAAAGLLLAWLVLERRRPVYH